jgi:hypothetical protein
LQLKTTGQAARAAHPAAQATACTTAAKATPSATAATSRSTPTAAKTAPTSTAALGYRRWGSNEEGKADKTDRQQHHGIFSHG